MTAPRSGDLIEDFSAPATGGGSLSLSQFKGRNVVLYFYPKDSTPGCTTEGQDFRDRIADFEAANTVVLGVSRDSVRSHENFKRKQAFPFDLLSDADESLCNRFDVIRTKKMYGREVRGIQRSTFLIDADSRLRREWRGVKVPGHAEEVLQAARELAG